MMGNTQNCIIVCHNHRSIYYFVRTCTANVRPVMVRSPENLPTRARSTRIKSTAMLGGAWDRWENCRVWTNGSEMPLSLIGAKKRSTQIKSYEILSLLLNYASIRSTTSLRKILTESKLICGSLWVATVMCHDRYQCRFLAMTQCTPLNK